MAHKIAGIDMCHGGLRIVALRSGFRKIQVDSVERIDLLGGCWKREDNNDLTLSEDCLRLLSEWVDANLTQGDVVVVSYPAIFSIVKRLKFPFKDAEKIRTALPFQLIGNFPADIEEIVTDFDYVDTGGKEASVIASGVIKEKFARFLTRLKEANIDPRVVTIDGFALRDLLKFTDADRRNENLLFMNICGDRIEIFATSAGKPAYVQNIYLHGFDGAAEKAGYAAKGLKSVLLAFITREEGRIDGVFVGGDESAEVFKTVVDVLEEFGIPHLDFSNLQIEMEGAAKVGGEFMKAFSLAIRGLLPAEQGRINLRRGEFIYSGNIRFIHQKMKYIATFLAFFLVMTGARGFLKISSLGGELKALKSELKIFSAGRLGKEFDDFEAALKYMNELSSEDVHFLPRWTAVEILKKIMNAAVAVVNEPGKETAGGALPEPGDEGLTGIGDDAASLELENLRIEPKSAYIRGEANSIVTIEKFIAKQKEDPCFKDVILEGSDRIQFQRHQGWLRFSIKAVIDCGGGQAHKEHEKKKIAGGGKEK